MRSLGPMPDTEKRLQVIGVFLVAVGVLFCLRLFQLQIIRGSELREQADLSQTKSLEIPASRGNIYAFKDGVRVPIVLNEDKWLLFADADFIESIDDVERELEALGVDVSEDNKQRIRDGSRYVVIARKLATDTRTAIEDKDIRGLYFQRQPSRTYTEGGLAAHTLGFVNDDGIGQYGVEQQYSEQLEGTAGRLKAVTDARGVPLAFEEANVEVAPKNGQDVTLTLDVGIQGITEDAIQKGVDSTGAIGGSVVVMEAETGAVRAMATYPSFKPANFSDVSDISLFTNAAVSEVIEPGSVVKTFVAAAALDQNVVGTEYTYFDSDSVTLDGATVTNSLDYGPRTRKIEEILINSLNTGTIHLLGLLGGGDVNAQARETLYDYYYNTFGLGQATGIDLPNEAVGRVFGPNEGFGLNIRYGNMTFGQGITVTPLQMTAAYSTILNGGNQITPHVVQSVGSEVVEPPIKQANVLSQQTQDETRELMRRMGLVNYADVQTEGLEISGKTGTAEIADPNGGYLEGVFTGTFAGYVKGEDTTLVIFVRLDRPQVEFASIQGSAPIWKDIVRGIVNTGKIN